MHQLLIDHATFERECFDAATREFDALPQNNGFQYSVSVIARAQEIKTERLKLRGLLRAAHDLAIPATDMYRVLYSATVYANEVTERILPVPVAPRLLTHVLAEIELVYGPHAADDCNTLLCAINW